MTAARPTADPDPLVPRLKELLCAALRSWRKSAPFGSALLVAVPDRLIDEIAVRWAPVERDVAHAAVEDVMRSDEFRRLLRRAVRAELADADDLAVIARTGTNPNLETHP